MTDRIVGVTDRQTDRGSGHLRMARISINRFSAPKGTSNSPGKGGNGEGVSNESERGYGLKNLKDATIM